MTPRSYDVTAVAEAIGIPVKQWDFNCHGISLAIVKSGLLGEFARVARGTANGVPGQHSWIVLGHDCYSLKATVVDPTLWTYSSDVDGIYVGDPMTHQHTPHGAGSIWAYGQPHHDGGTTITLTPSLPLGREARSFLGLIEPLDRLGWGELAHSPVGGWPAGEILAAMDDTLELMGLVPIDRIGMLTDRNPNGLYLAPEDGS